MAETMENGKGEQENQGENAGQKAGHKHVRGYHRNSKQQQIVLRKGRKEKRQTNQP